MSKYYPPVTATGNPVNFSAPNGGKLDSVSVPIIPSQDLHGYDHPWGPGGGVNLFDKDNVEWFNGIGSSGNQKKYGHAFTAAGTYALKCYGTSNTSRPQYFIKYADNTWVNATSISTGKIVTIASGDTLYAIWGGYTPSDTEAYKAQAIASFNEWQVQVAFSSTQPSEWYPYSNVCPISGLTGLSVYVGPTQDPDDATEYAVDWSTQAGTVCSGSVDVVSGELTVDMMNIPSYNGETINEPWLSSMDEYTPGATPTTGAQVVYTLADPAVYQLGHQFLTVLSGANYVWASNNATITVVYALLVPGSDTKYTLIVNGTDITDFVERDSYRTTLYPVFSEAVQTLDGVGHTALLRKKGELSARFNPRTAADTAIICAALLNAPCEVRYHCLQRNADVTALMTIDSVSAQYLSRCLYCGLKWNDIDSITLTEL